MKIGIVATADDNLYASTLFAWLARGGQTPTCVILAAEPAWRRLIAHVRVAGVGPTLRKLARRYNVGGLPDRDARHYLREYGAGRGLPDWDTPLSKLAAQSGSDLIRVPSMHSDEAVAAVRRHGLDLLLNTAGVIFKTPLLAAPRVGMLNAHMARLPRFRGMNVLEWSVWFGEPPAITIHLVTPGIDLGDLLAVEQIDVHADDTLDTLRARSYPVMIEAMADSIAALSEGREIRTPQTPDQGKQYFVMHPTLRAIAEQRLFPTTRH